MCLEGTPDRMLTTAYFGKEGQLVIHLKCYYHKLS
jgi:hypothetical protein